MICLHTHRVITSATIDNKFTLLVKCLKDISTTSSSCIPVSVSVLDQS